MSADQESTDNQGDRQPDRYADQEATARVPMVSDAARAQLAAIRDEFVAPLVDRIGSLERENGRLEAEREQASRERDALRAEVERLRAGEEAPRTPPAPPGATEAAPAPFAPSVAAWRARTTREVDLDAPARPAPWWRRWLRRIRG